MKQSSASCPSSIGVLCSKRVLQRTMDIPLHWHVRRRGVENPSPHTFIRVIPSRAVNLRFAIPSIESRPRLCSLVRSGAKCLRKAFITRHIISIELLVLPVGGLGRWSSRIKAGNQDRGGKCRRGACLPEGRYTSPLRQGERTSGSFTRESSPTRGEMSSSLPSSPHQSHGSATYTEAIVFLPITMSYSGVISEQALRPST